MNKESPLTRIRWWLEDLADAPLPAKLRWQLADFREAHDGRVLVGALVLLAVLVAGGFATARAVAGGSHAASGDASVRLVTLHRKVRVRVHGHVVTRWRTRNVYAKAQTVMQTETIHTPNGTRVVTHPVTRYHVVYRKRVVRVHGKTRTVLRPVTKTQTLTNTKTQLFTVTHQVTDSQTVTQPVTSVVTTTVVSTETVTVPITITITVPITTG